MIHSTTAGAALFGEGLDEITPDAERPPQPQGAASPLPFVRPAEYYARPDRIRLFPRWVPFGCGTLALIFLIVIFVAGAMVASGGAGSILDGAFGMLQSDVDGRLAKNVPPSQKAEFDAQMNALRAKARAGKVRFDTVQPLLREINDATNEKSITPEETQRLIEAVRNANATGAK